MRPIALAATLAFTSLIPVLAQVPLPPMAVALRSPDERVERLSEKLAYGSKLWVRNVNGSITVSGWEKEEVSLTAEIRGINSRRIQLAIQRKGNDLDIEAIHPRQGSSFFGFTGGYPKYKLSLQVPRKLLGHFKTVNGDVNASGLEGYARCETTNGDIELRDVAGEVFVETTNGTIRATNLNARIKGETTNGSIFLERVAGGIQMATTNGRIEARWLDGWGEGISLESTNGSIEVELGAAKGEILAENTNAPIQIEVPGAQVQAHEKHHLSATIPGRTQKIKLETTNGRISIR